jgi:hypothetical protein
MRIDSDELAAIIGAPSFFVVQTAFDTICGLDVNV